MSMMRGPVILDIQGTALTAEDRTLLGHPQVGGLILFTRNYVSVQQLCSLVRDVRTIRPNILIVVDQEGGPVMRFTTGFSPMISAEEIGSIYKSDPIRATQLAKQQACLMATELKSCGVDMSLTPVVDCFHVNNPVLVGRCYGNTPEVVVALARATIAGMAEAGMPATLKHYPGHGGVTIDSHLGMPVDERPKEEIEADAAIFETLLLEANVGAVMPAHICYPALDDTLATYSTYWLTTRLRHMMGFCGWIFSDDLSMAGSGTESLQSRTERSLAAGCDFLFVCNDRQAAVEVLKACEQHESPQEMIQRRSQVQ